MGQAYFPEYHFSGMNGMFMHRTYKATSIALSVAVPGLKLIPAG